MARKRDEDYFERFVSLVKYSCEAADLLKDVLANYQTEELQIKMKDMHVIEHQADIEKHLMMQKLAKEFITPIEREDIMEMAHQIDNVTDAIEDVVMRLYMFDILEVRPEALELSKVICKLCDALKTALMEFSNFRKSKNLHSLIIEINRLEEDGDRIYMEAMRNLYVSSKDTIEIIRWTKTFDCLEKCCDVCENVADVIESVIMKNS